MKVCIKCNNEKHESEFHKDRRRPDNLFPYCKRCRSKTAVPRKNRTLEQVLSNYLVSNNGCWEWQGTLSREGYGVCFYKRVRQRAHRLSFFREYRPGSETICVLHKCDNRRCINPSHLYLGTNKDNSKDMIDRNRTNPRKGEDSPLSKITRNQAIDIFLDERTYKEIARDYGIAATTVQSIKNRRNWRHETEKYALIFQ